MGVAPSYLNKLLERTHEPMGLALAALSLGKESVPTVDVTNCMDRVVTLASDICEHLPPSPATGDVLFALNTHLFDRLSYPCRMADEPGHGPFFHLLLRVADGGDEDVIDPCAGGVILTRAELKNLFEHAVGGAVESQLPYRNYLERMDDRAILIRLLHRFKSFHLARRHYGGALAASRSILQLTPHDGVELLEYARILEATADTEAAAAIYFHYLERYPGCPNTRQLRQKLRGLLGKRHVLH